VIQVSRFITTCQDCGAECNAFKDYNCPKCGLAIVISEEDNSNILKLNEMFIADYKTFCEKRS